jgi:hypothetical protein
MNYRSLLSLICYKFTGNLNSSNDLLVSSDLSPLNEEEKSLINSIFLNNCYVNTNEKIAPQVLSRVFECLYLKNEAAIATTNVKIGNLNQLLNSLQLLNVRTTPLPTPTITTTITPTPSITPTITTSTTFTPSVTVTPTRSVSVTPTFTPSTTVTPTTFTCKVYQFYANNGNIGTGTFTGCDGTSFVNDPIPNGNIICVASSSTPSSSDGYFIDLESVCI